MMVIDVSGSQLKYSIDGMSCEATKNTFLDSFTQQLFAHSQDNSLTHRYAIVKHNNRVLNGANMGAMKGSVVCSCCCVNDRVLTDFETVQYGTCGNRVICGGQRVSICGGSTSLLSGLS
jgi:hypothetical protein